ncbi:MAG: DUF4007 family protein [Anaerolineales bacterium]|nr:DUF4007 family protein [Anaerolineales bacterium]
MDLATEDPTIFTHSDALVRLGVGKNMVRSIRHWCLATGVLESPPSSGPKTALQPTPLGTLLFGREGRDPYLEDVGTLWLLHWQLVSGVYSYVWELVFTTFLEREFTRQRLTDFVRRQFDRDGIRTTSQMVQREIDVCLRTYVPAKAKGTLSSEDGLDCPLAELSLMRSSREERIYTFMIGPKPLLPTEIFGYALLQFLAQIAQHRRAVAVDECLYRPGSPGQAFKLDENSVVAYLEALEQKTAGSIRLQETAGLRQLYLHSLALGHVSEHALDLLRSYYE